jgi:hypothetical protein
MSPRIARHEQLDLMDAVTAPSYGPQTRNSPMVRSQRAARNLEQLLTSDNLDGWRLQISSIRTEKSTTPVYFGGFQWTQHRALIPPGARPA